MAQDALAPQSGAQAETAYALDDFSALLQKEFKPNTDTKKSRIEEAVKTLGGMFDGLDVVKNGGEKRKRKADEDEEKGKHDEGEDEEQPDFAKQEQQRLQSEHKRVQLVLKDRFPQVRLDLNDSYDLAGSFCLYSFYIFKQEAGSSDSG